MQRRDQFRQGLLELHRMKDGASQRSAWRSSLASLGQACAEDERDPLEGLPSSELGDSLRTALAIGLVDDLDWLSSSTAAAALYEIASALPAGAEKREIGRRVLGWLLEGEAATFVALATRMALGTGKGLSGEGVRARVALSLALPARHGVRADSMALAILSRRELARQWVGALATGPLADRRLAGRLLEQAARAAARRGNDDDERALGAFRGEAAQQSWRRLLDDREPVVWRHVAVARGLLASQAPQHLDAIEQGLRPELSPTEWRRAATSAVALMAVRPEQGLRLVRDAISRGLLKRDPGAVAALLWGVPAAAEVEPEASEELLDDLFTESDPLLMAEAFGDVLAQGPGGDFADRVRVGLLDLLGKMAPGSRLSGEVDDGAVALRAHVVASLRPAEEREAGLVDALTAALDAYANHGARMAFAASAEVLAAADGALATLEALGDDSALARRTGSSALRSLDAGMLEDGLLRDLLQLGGRADSQRAIETYERSLDRLGRWLVEHEQNPAPRQVTVLHRTMRLGRLRAILRLADARSSDDHEGSLAVALQRRRFQLASLMLRHLVMRPPQVLHRTIAAAFARAVDALLRDDSIDLADVLLVVAQRALTADDVRMLIEASMHTDLRSALRAFLTLLSALEAAEGGSSLSGEFALSPAMLSNEFHLPGSPSQPPGSIVLTQVSGAPAVRKVEALMALARGLEVDASSRTEALRGALFRLGRALGRLLNAPSLASVAGVGSSESSPVRDLEQAITTLAQLGLGARQRLEALPADTRGSLPSLSLAPALDGVLRGSDTDGLVFAVASAREELALGLPPVLVDIVATALETLMTLPLIASTRTPQPAPAAEKSLPAWLPRRRTLGGFYVVRSLGSGAGGTVFVVRRIEDRHNAQAEQFALKVPDYDGNAARSLSEEQFLQLFREEASALLGLPAHPNLARFVTFDLAARPKPILVMELVEGLSLERVLLAGKVSMAAIFEALDGVLAGLEAMHGKGIGHLDVKPSNVILRAGRTPVLVDFGLSGRNIRPGCATLPYGAPEVWGLVTPGHTPTPPPVDVYAAACMAFEMLTTHDLFDGQSENAIIGAHATSDGWPAPLQRMARDPSLRPLATTLSAALRRHPGERSSARALRLSLRELAPSLLVQPWPLRF